MNTYKRHRFPAEIISYAVWLYYRFNLSYRCYRAPGVPDHSIEDLLAQRGITVTRESIRLWCIKFGALYARRLKRKHRGYGDTFYIDEVFAGVPDHSDQWQTTLPVESCRPGWRSGGCFPSGETRWCCCQTFLQAAVTKSWRRAQEDRDG